MTRRPWEPAAWTAAAPAILIIAGLAVISLAYLAS